MKTSVTLSDDRVDAIDRQAREQGQNRSDFIETAVRTFSEQLARNERNARDLEILNQHADRLNEEAADVLEYQVAP